MDSNVTSNVPPTQPKTAGRKKIKIERIEDSRNRQVTFLKRKNGLLKKAMELGILCDCEVAVIIFNINNGKLFEYSSVEPEAILQKYATYSGPSERRKKDKFFDLAASKGTSNIPLNEPRLAQAAMDAAVAAGQRPRPFHKFKNAGGEMTEDVYHNGRKLSSGESPGNTPTLLSLQSPDPVPPMNHLLPRTATETITAFAKGQVAVQSEVQPTLGNAIIRQKALSSPASNGVNNQAAFVRKGIDGGSTTSDRKLGMIAEGSSLGTNRGEEQKLAVFPANPTQNNGVTSDLGAALATPNAKKRPRTASIAVPTIQSHELINSKPQSFDFTPRFTAEVPVPPLFTPNTAGRHLSEVLGLNSATPGSVDKTRFPFANLMSSPDRQFTDVSNQTPRNVDPERMVNPSPEESESNLGTCKKQRNEEEAAANTHRIIPSLGELPDINATAGKMQVATTKNLPAVEITNDLNVGGESDTINEKSDGKQSASTQGPSRKKPNLTVLIPNSNRDDQTAITSSGLFSAESHHYGNDIIPGLGPPLGTSRLPSMSAVGHDIWSPWHGLTLGERDMIPAPLTPFPNENLGGIGELGNSGMGSGVGQGYSLPSPTDAGLIPLTPRFLSYDPFTSARIDPPSAPEARKDAEDQAENRGSTMTSKQQ